MSALHIGPNGFVAPVVDLRAHRPSGHADRVRSEYESRYGAEPEKPGGWYRPDDWARISYVAGRLEGGGRVLDVGVGAGQFLNLLAVSERFTRVTGVDHVVFEKYFEMSEQIERRTVDITGLPFADGEFDVVTCMEVLEHVDTDTFVTGLAELRRVCAGQLAMTVPFCEPEPISATHVRRFVASDAVELFPDAWFTILDRPNRPWLLIEERFDGSAPTAGALGAARPTAREAATARVQHVARRLRSRAVRARRGITRRIPRRLRPAEPS